ncbi:MAG: hypothetical protein ACSLFB_14335, partial [Acidimicrobiales bacterium]
MNLIIDLLNQPIVLTLLSLIIGGYLLSLIADRRARKDKVREKAIEFLTEVGDDINIVASLIYEQLWTEDAQDSSILKEKIGVLFTKRISVQVKSQAYLNSEDFYRQYNLLVWEFEGVRYFLSKLETEDIPEQIIIQIQKRRNRLNESWLITN